VLSWPYLRYDRVVDIALALMALPKEDCFEVVRDLPRNVWSAAGLQGSWGFRMACNQSEYERRDLFFEHPTQEGVLMKNLHTVLALAILSTSLMGRVTLAQDHHDCRVRNCLS
jgi:hypothetical protein